jgi:hypothetical protein
VRGYALHPEAQFQEAQFQPAFEAVEFGDEAMAGQGASVTLWIDAFIPKDVTGYTQQVMKGPNLGKTAIPLPTAARLNPLNTFKDWNCGFLTDQRAFSEDPTSSVRMRSLAVVQLSPATIASQSHTSSGTTQVNMSSGATTGFKTADMSRCRFGTMTQAPGGSPSFGTPKLPKAPIQSSGSAFSFTVTGAAADPLVSSAADIDYVGTFTFRFEPATSRLTVEFDGKVDAFPAFECYANFGGKTKALFTLPPPAGHTVVNLLGAANTPAKGKVTFP